MKKITLFLLTILSFSVTFGQGNSTFEDYEKLFLKVDHSRKISSLKTNYPNKYQENSVLKYDKVYDILLIYRDGRPSEKWKFSFKVSGYTLGDLLMPEKDLILLKNGVPEAFPKWKLDYFVLDDVIFESGNKNSKKEITRYSFLDTWGILKYSGPVRVVKSYSWLKSSKTWAVDEDITKDGETLYINPLKWSITMSELTADYTELSQKIAEKTEGYKSKNEQAIILAYNKWFKENKDQEYRNSVYPKQFLQSPQIVEAVGNSQSYNQLFSQIDHDENAEKFSTNVDFSKTNNLFSPDSLYDILLYYKDGRPREKAKFSFSDRNYMKKYYQSQFTGFLLFTNEVSDIPIVRDGESTLLEKSDLLYYVIDKRFIFVHSSVFENEFESERWGLLSMNGPVSEVKWFVGTGERVYGDKLFYFNGKQQKVNWVAGLGRWKKNYIELFKDHEVLVGKIVNKEKGYKGFSVSRNIAIEYNEWVKENDPERYEKFTKPE